MSTIKFKEQSDKTPYFLLAVIIFVFITVLYVHFKSGINTSLNMDYERPTIISSIDIIGQDGMKTREQLPKSFKHSPQLTFDVDLSEVSSLSGKSLSINTAYTTLELIFDGKVFYSYYPDQGGVVKSGASNFHLVLLPSNLNSNVLTVKMTPMLSKYNEYRISPLMIGYRSQIVKHCLNGDGPQIILSTFLILTSLLLVGYAVVLLIKGKTSGDLLYMALMAFNIGLYVLLQSWVLQLFYRNSQVIYIAKYASYMLLLVPMMIIVKDKVDKKFEIIFRVLIALGIFNLFIQTLLVLLSINEYREFRWLTLAFHIICFLATVAGIVFTDSKKYPERRNLILSFTPLLIFFVIGVISYMLYLNINYLFSLAIGIAGFMVIQVYLFVEKYLKEKENILKANFYKDLAYTDILSGCGTRAAFTYAKEKLYQHDNRDFSLGIVVFDLNDLKQINDNFGHYEGDVIISEFGRILRENSDSEEINAYRTGGDEFVIFMKGYSLENLREYIDRLKENVEKYNSIKTIKISYAVGYEFVESLGDKDLEELLINGDKAMYENKKLVKEGQL